jgi:hypothetical protein
VPTGLRRSAFEKVDRLAYSSSRVHSVLPKVGGERLANKPFLARSLINPAVASCQPRPKVFAAPPVAIFLLIEVPRHFEGMWEGCEHLDRKRLRPYRRAGKISRPFSHL